MTQEMNLLFDGTHRLCFHHYFSSSKNGLYRLDDKTELENVFANSFGDAIKTIAFEEFFDFPRQMKRTENRNVFNGKSISIYALYTVVTEWISCNIFCRQAKFGV